MTTKYEAEIMTRWTREMRAEVGMMANVPLLAKMFAVDAWSDVTAQESATIPTEPNVLILRCQASKAVLDEIKADPGHHCLWCRPVVGTDTSAELPDADIPAAEEVKLRSFLGSRGISRSKREIAVGPRARGRTRRNVAERVKEWARTLTKAQPVSTT